MPTNEERRTNDVVVTVQLTPLSHHIQHDDNNNSNDNDNDNQHHHDQVDSQQGPSQWPARRLPPSSVFRCCRLWVESHGSRHDGSGRQIRRPQLPSTSCHLEQRKRNQSMGYRWKRIFRFSIGILRGQLRPLPSKNHRSTCRPSRDLDFDVESLPQ